MLNRILNHKKYILLTVLLLILTAFVTSELKKPKLNTAYPPVKTLTRTDNLICEKEMLGKIGAYDTCDRKNTGGFIMPGKQKQVEAARVGQTEKWISKESFDKPKIKYRTESGFIYIKDVRLIEDITNEEEKQFKIVSEDDKHIIAQLSEKATIATTSATLFLDKSKGLLVKNDISTFLFCGESVTSTSILYSCREN